MLLGPNLALGGAEYSIGIILILVKIFFTLAGKFYGPDATAAVNNAQTSNVIF